MNRLKVAHLHIVAYFTPSGVDDGNANPHPFANSITERPSVARALQE
jgi:hypothetical protein